MEKELLLPVEPPISNGHGFARVERTGRRELECAGTDTCWFIHSSQHDLPRMLHVGHVYLPP